MLRLDLKVKEIKRQPLFFLAPTLMLGSASDGFFSPLGKDGLRFLSVAELERLTNSPEIVIGFKSSGAFTPRYCLPSTAFCKLLSRLDRRINEMATNEYRWSQGKTSPDRPILPTDCEFLSQYVLIGNLEPFHATTDMNVFSNMLDKVVSHDTGIRADPDFLRQTLSSMSLLRPTNLGLTESKVFRSMLVLKLMYPIRAGSSLYDSNSVIKRIRANDDEDEYGIYLTRQFLNDREADLLLSSIATPTDSIFLMARRLTKKVELDDFIRLMFKNSLETILHCEVHVFLSTLRHKWNGQNYTEESVLMAAITTKEGGKP